MTVLMLVDEVGRRARTGRSARSRASGVGAPAGGEDAHEYECECECRVRVPIAVTGDRGDLGVEGTGDVGGLTTRAMGTADVDEDGDGDVDAGADAAGGAAVEVASASARGGDSWAAPFWLVVPPPPPGGPGRPRARRLICPEAMDPRRPMGAGRAWKRGTAGAGADGGMCEMTGEGKRRPGPPDNAPDEGDVEVDAERREATAVVSGMGYSNGPSSAVGVDVN